MKHDEIKRKIDKAKGSPRQKADEITGHEDLAGGVDADREARERAARKAKDEIEEMFRDEG